MADQVVYAYTDPEQPGAPMEGDLVVVAACWDKSFQGRLATLETVGRRALMETPWIVSMPGCAFPRWAVSVRRPTEAELAAWVLDQPGGSL